MSEEMNETTVGENEWSFLVDASKIGDDAQSYDIKPESQHIVALCKRLNLYDIERLDAKVVLKRSKVNRYIHVTGVINSCVLQKCVVTTDPVKEQVEDEFETWFAEETSAVSFSKAKRDRMSAKEREELPILEEEEDPEPVIDGKIDIGEVVVQNLSLALNPYPRVEGADFDGKSKNLDDVDNAVYDNPFAALKDWKKKEEEGE